MKRFIRKSMFFIPVVILICMGLFLSQTQAETVKRTVERSAAKIQLQLPTRSQNVLKAQEKPILKPTKTKILTDMLKTLCPADDYCQMEKCSKFYHTLNFLGGIFKNDPNLNTPNAQNSIELGPVPGPEMGTSIHWICVGYPRDVYDNTIFPMLSACAAGMGASSFSNSACTNPIKALQNYDLAFYFDVNDINNLNSSILNYKGIDNFFNAVNIVPVCVDPNFNLLTLKEACENNCCFE